MHDVDHFGHHTKFDRPVAADKSNARGTLLENFLESATERFPSHRYLVDEQRPVRMNLYNNYESVPCLFDRLRRWLWNQRIQTLG